MRLGRMVLLTCDNAHTGCRDCGRDIPQGEPFRWNANPRSPIRYLCLACYEVRREKREEARARFQASAEGEFMRECLGVEPND